MKKITLLFAAMLASWGAEAQLAPGSLAPDFSVQDINGNTHTLSEYLAAGKTVIIDISATWCGPCWNYHNNLVLDDMYYCFGPGGSDEVVVLFVEGDPQTTLADLHGTGFNTQGDWVTGSPYPIIDSGMIADLYDIEYFPTVFRICPDGIVTEVGTVNANSLRNGINNACGGTLQGVQNHVHGFNNENRFCSTTGAPVASLRNVGDNSINSATLNLYENGILVGTKAWTGLWNRFASRTITFDSIEVDPEATYTFEVVDVNSTPVLNPEIAHGNLGVAVAGQAGTEATIKIYTDNYPTEISWKLRNSANTVVAQGGPYAGSANGGGVNANTVKTHELTLVPGECYSIQLLDSFGDGWSLGPTPHGVEIVSNGETILSYFVGNFGSNKTIAAVASTSALGVEGVDAHTFGIYPNPTSGIVNINAESDVDVVVTNMLGKAVFSAKGIASGGQIDLSGFEKGIYLAKISGAQGTSVEKIILN